MVARAHQTLIWERPRTLQRLRSTLREYFPGALTAYAGLELISTDARELLIKAPTPEEAARLTKPQITAVLTRHRRRNREQRAGAIQAALRESQLGLPAPVTTAYGAAVTAPREGVDRAERADTGTGRAGERPFSRAPGR